MIDRFDGRALLDDRGLFMKKKSRKRYDRRVAVVAAVPLLSPTPAMIGDPLFGLTLNAIHQINPYRLYEQQAGAEAAAAAEQACDAERYRDLEAAMQADAEAEKGA